MERGKWSLQYEDFDSMENSVSAARIRGKVELEASTEAEAVKKGAEAWKEELSRYGNRRPGGRHQGWDKNIYPHSPRVVYEIPLVDRPQATHPTDTPTP